MAEKQTNHNYILGLEDNAFSSLEHGMEHYLEGGDRDLKFTVLHIFHAVELLLKARLAKAHPLLVLQMPEDDPSTGYTAEYRTMLRRLKNLGVEFTKEDTDNLEALRTTRNSIEHYKVEGDRRKIEDYIAKAVKLLDRFAEKELKIRLKDRIRPELYKEMEAIVYTHEERLQRAKQQISQITGHIRYPNDDEYYAVVVCEECRQQTVLIYDLESSNGLVRCYFCDATFHCWHCDRCGEPVLSSEPDDERDTDICEDCWEDILGED